jgi:hypothetical protein
LGDVDAARGCVGGEDGDAVEERVVEALCDMADGEYEAALGKWRALRELVDDEMVGVNLAVCLLYVGKMQEVSAAMFSTALRMMCADVKLGQGIVGTARGLRSVLAYAALQSVDHVRALHG